jgi:DNA-binding transcriptional MerR regulator/methylmalonyl-CoA mutase cobalamin-binding subunit
MVDRNYRIQMAASLTGVSEGLIRAWERRYGVVKPRRTPSGYRVYTEEDLALLRRLRQLTEEGVSIAEAALMIPALRRELRQSPPPPAAPAATIAQVDRWKAELLAAAGRFDQHALDELLDQALAVLPPLAFFDQLVVPLQREVGDRWHDGRMAVAGEHLVTQSVRVRMLALLTSAPRLARAHVVCATFPDELHEVGLIGAALRFRHHGCKVTYLGASTPFDEVARVVEGTRPQAVALSAVIEIPRRRFRSMLRQVMAVLPAGLPVLLGGAEAARQEKVIRELGGAYPVLNPDDWQTALRRIGAA